MFYNCISLRGDIPENFFQGCTALADIHGFFRNCEGLTGSPKTNFWYDAYMINNASYLFAGCKNLGGDPSNLQEIPRDFFATKYRLTTIAHIFEGCEFLQFTLQSEWFKDCRQLANIDYAFAISVSSLSIFGSSVSMFSSENWQVPTFLCPPPLYLSIRLPTSSVAVRFKIL